MVLPGEGFDRKDRVEVWSRESVSRLAVRYALQQNKPKTSDTLTTKLLPRRLSARMDWPGPRTVASYDY